MKIATIGKGNVGSGLATLWEKAGHEVTLFGRAGGDVSDADVVFIAVPGETIKDAVERMTGLDGKVAIDATNLIRGATPPEGFDSNAEYVKSVTGAPTAKAWNVNFAVLFDKAADASTRPGNFWCGDEETRDTVEILTREAGYEPISSGPLENAGKLEAMFGLLFATVMQGGGMAPFFYKISEPAQF
jgi:8-hydroxy-5-deazaflavin:NADPH oxidoreductase